MCIDLRRVRVRSPEMLRAALTFAAVLADKDAKDKGANDSAHDKGISKVFLVSAESFIKSLF